MKTKAPADWTYPTVLVCFGTSFIGLAMGMSSPLDVITLMILYLIFAAQTIQARWFRWDGYDANGYVSMTWMEKKK